MNANEVIATARQRELGASGPSQRPRQRRRSPPTTCSRRPSTSPRPTASSTTCSRRWRHLAGGAGGARPTEFADVVKCRAHAPDGRHAGHARPGVRRLRRAGPATASSASRRRFRGLRELPLGGTAVGTGINAPAGFAAVGDRSCSRDETGLPLTEARDHFEAQGARDGLVEASGALRTVAVEPHQDRQRPPLDGLRPARRARRDRACPTCSRARRSCRARSTR